MQADSKRVLLVEDNDATRALLDEMLRALGHDVDAVSGGSDALKALKANAYDFAVLDIVLPTPDGLELIGWIRKNIGALPIVAISAAVFGNGRSYSDVAVSLGADVALAKPVEPEALKSAVAKIEALRRAAPAR